MAIPGIVVIIGCSCDTGDDGGDGVALGGGGPGP